MFVSVAVPVPHLGLLTYAVPIGVEPPARGARVLVPLGTRQVTGCVMQVDVSASVDLETRDLVAVLDEEPFVPGHVLDLAAWVAEYYAAGPGEAVSAAMPPGAWLESERVWQLLPDAQAQSAPDGSIAARIVEALRTAGSLTSRQLVSQIRPAPETERVLAMLRRRGLVRSSHVSPARTDTFKTVRIAALTAQGHDVAGSVDDLAALGERQREALAVLGGVPDGLPLPALKDHGIQSETVRRLASRGLATIRRERIERDPFATVATVPADEAGSTPGARVLTGEQAPALERLTALASTDRFEAALLHGVTGSGKTELYLRLAAHVLGQGRRVLVLVPEIALTPAVAAVFRRTFGARVAIQHSGLSDGQRHDQWHRIRDGAIDIVVGTRSAVFAPLDRVGLIIVDEEHDSSYKQEETPRYNGRDVAVVRARSAGALIVLGSATPAMETYRNALDGRYALVRLTRRVLDRPLASVTVVNMRDEIAAAGEEVVLSGPLLRALDTRLGRGEQALLLLNRRGFASAVFCRQCGATFDCPNCSVSLTVHHGARQPGRGRCHYCNYSIAVPPACPNCAGPYLERVGFGTERVEAEVRRLLPSARLARVDRDTMQRRGAVERTLTRFAAGELDVIVGTQMIAKGHDFPAVTLVGVISADIGLGLPDFRASERTFQLLTQVAGRAGRGEIPGEAIVQTLFPDHYSIQLACRQDYEGFYEQEIQYRRAMRYPPSVALVNLVVRGRTFGGAMRDAGDLATRLRAEAASGDVRVLGPAPAPIGKLRGEYRAQLLIKGLHRPAMRQAVVAAIAASPDLQRRVTIDVDPLSMM